MREVVEKSSDRKSQRLESTGGLRASASAKITGSFIKITEVMERKLSRL